MSPILTPTLPVSVSCASTNVLPITSADHQAIPAQTSSWIKSAAEDCNKIATIAAVTLQLFPVITSWCRVSIPGPRLASMSRTVCISNYIRASSPFPGAIEDLVNAIRAKDK